jgi:hypothetical protein
LGTLGIGRGWRASSQHPSTGLFGALTERQIEVVVQHERHAPAADRPGASRSNSAGW